ncbi:MAG: SDR family NAD(P)-dependent oxidoreductase [Pseudomonadota bacterium]|nr:SDR family NAD(P)-dependent oxidoreductase [Pseudomonadota bacterium]MEE2821101.1 SDR family NAD(P)-dependent oxidoreductase [Pseudomonadota bacterium]
MARILVTGGSAGIGQAVVEHLIKQGHEVICTSRSVQSKQGSVEWSTLDLSQPDSVQAFCQSPVWEKPIDAVFNNAGFGLIAPIESASDDAIRQQFETNYFGTMAITRQAMEHFRQHGCGTLMVNTSIGGRMAFPYFGYYNATKHALEASYEALWYECRGSDIQIKIIEPGFTQTNFATHGMQMSGEKSPYHVDGLSWLARSMREGTTATPPTLIAPVIVRALFDTKNTLRYHAGKHSSVLLLLRKLLPDSWFQALISRAVLLGQQST